MKTIHHSLYFLSFSFCAFAQFENPAFVGSLTIANPASTVTPTITFSGKNLFAPLGGNSTHASGIMIQQGTNVVLDSANDSGAYSFFGTNISNCIVTSIFNVKSFYASASSPTNWHYGLGIRSTSDGTFSCMVLISPKANPNGLQIVDRIAGVEYRSNYPVATTSNVNYQVCITNNTANSANVGVWNWDTKTLLTNLTYTFTAGYSNSGWPVLHAYAGSIFITNSYVWDTNGTLISGGPFCATRTKTLSSTWLKSMGLVNSSSSMTMSTDGSSDSLQQWHDVMTPNTWNSGLAIGNLTPVSGDICGITFRNSAVGAGFLAYYNNINNSVNIARTVGSIVNITNKPCTLSMGTSYPWSLGVTGNVYTFTINGVSLVNNSDATYTSGFFGFCGSNSVATHDTIVLK